MTKLLASFNSHLIATKYTKYIMINEINFKVTLKSYRTLINYIIFINEIAQIYFLINHALQLAD